VQNNLSKMITKCTKDSQAGQRGSEAVKSSRSCLSNAADSKTTKPCGSSPCHVVASASSEVYKSAGVVNDVQLYLGLFVCANGKTGGSIRYHVSRTTVASCATDMAQYGILCKISWKPVYKRDKPAG